MTLLGCSFQNFRRAFPYFMVPLIWPRNAIQRINRSPVGKCYKTNRAIHCIVIGPVDSVIHVSNNVTPGLMLWLLFCFLNSKLFSFKSKSSANESSSGSESSSSVNSAAKIRVLNHKDCRTWKVSYKYFVQNMPCKHALAAYQEDFDHTIVQ